MENRRCSAAVASCWLLALALLAPQIAAAEGATQAPQPAMTRTNIAQQVQMLANVPALYNVPAPAPVTLPAASAVNQFQSTGNAQPSTQEGQREEVRYQWTPQAAPEAQAASQQQTAATTQAATQPAQQAGPGQLPPLPQQRSAPGAIAPQTGPNPQGAFNMLGSAVQAAGSVANAGQALSNAGAAANSGDLLTTLGSTAQAFQAVQKAASDVGAAQKTIQSGGAAVAPSAAQQQQQQQVQAAPAPPTININIPGLGGNGGAAQGPPGISYTPPAAQGTSQVAQPYGATQAEQAPPAQQQATASDPLAAIGSALAQAAFGGGAQQQLGSAGNTATLQSRNGLGRKMT